ncbi:MAG: BamA/TamA family outer membrane protein [Bdellovibrionales bacterium]|nr:BamA/TamA family outer membrane protein [Oligoflexia bacterium]
MNIAKLSIIAILIGLLQIGNARAYPVSEIQVEGVAADQVEVVKTLSGLLPGDDYERSRAERGEEKIVEYFSSKGFPQVEVRSDVLAYNERHVVRFKIQLGPAIRISEVTFACKQEVLSPVLTSRLFQAVDLKPGEYFDRDRIKEMRRAAESVLFSQNFIDSKVSDIGTEVTSSGLKLRFMLELGQKVALSVSGNEYYSRSELMTFIEEQRALGLGRDYGLVLSTRIKELYIEHGFRRVSIMPYSFEPHGNEPKKVVFDISEGPRVMIRSLIFDGNEVFKDLELNELFYKNAADRIIARIYNAKMVDSTAHGMIDELKKRGYLSAKLIAIKTEEAGEAGVNLRIFISEGLQTRIQAIDFKGNHVFTVEQLDGFLGLHENDPLNLVQLEDGLDQIKKQYRNLGHLNFKVNNELSHQLVTYSEKNQFAYLNLDLDEGQVIRLGEYKLFGNDKTKPVVIERELRIKVGEPLGEARVVETEERLRRLGIFGQVNLEFKDSEKTPNTKDMRVSVQEAVPGNTSTGIGFRNDLGVRVFGELSYANLWGMNHTWALNVTANRRLNNFKFFEYSAQVSYTWPWALLGETTFRPSLLAEKRQYIQFNAETYAFSANLERMLYRPLKFSGSFNYTLERVRQFGAVELPAISGTSLSQNQQIRIGSVTPTLRLDLRDNPVVPRRGFFALTSFEYANSFLGTQIDPIPVSYGRFQVRTDLYLDFIPHIIWFSSIRGGWLRNFINPYQSNGQLDPRVTVPLIKQFALGGINSIRGFVEQELNVQSDGNAERRVQGYSTYVNYRTQMDFFVSPNLSFGPFLDAGNLQVDAFSMGNLRYGTGVGMRYLTPVGPINFDWGFKLFPHSGEESNVFYFSLGVI